MKTTSIPFLRVASNVCRAIARQKLQQKFIAYGIASRDEAKYTSEYYPAEDVLRELDDLLAQAKSK